MNQWNKYILFFLLFFLSCTSTYRLRQFVKNPAVAGSGWSTFGGNYLRYNYSPVKLDTSVRFLKRIKYNSSIAGQYSVYGDLLLIPLADGHVKFIDRRNFEEIADLKLSYGLDHGLLISGAKLVIPNSLGDFGVRIIDLDNIRQISRIGEHSASGGILLSDHELIFVDSRNRLIFADLETGAILNSILLKGPYRSEPLLSDGIIYFLTRNGYCVAVDKIQRKILWQQKIPGEYNNSPMLADGKIYTFSVEGIWSILNAENGKLIKSDTTNIPVRGNVALYPREQLIIIPSIDHHVYGFSTTENTLKWSVKTESIVTATPFLTDNMIIVGSWDKYLYFISNRGNLLKKIQFSGVIKSGVLVYKNNLFVDIARKGTYIYEISVSP
ncbi:MAG: hypothetical protein Kow00108_08360 [Calditrichia bacterium]